MVMRPPDVGGWGSIWDNVVHEETSNSVHFDPNRKGLANLAEIFMLSYRLKTFKIISSDELSIDVFPIWIFILGAQSCTWESLLKKIPWVYLDQ